MSRSIFRRAAPSLYARPAAVDPAPRRRPPAPLPDPGLGAGCPATVRQAARSARAVPCGSSAAPARCRRWSGSAPAHRGRLLGHRRERRPHEPSRCSGPRISARPSASAAPLPSAAPPTVVRAVDGVSFEIAARRDAGGRRRIRAAENRRSAAFSCGSSSRARAASSSRARTSTALSRRACARFGARRRSSSRTRTVR